MLNVRESIILILLAIGTGLVALHVAKQNKIHLNNLEVATDSIRTLKLKNGEMLTEKRMYQLREKELEKYLDISKKERKDIEKKLNAAIAYISKVESKVEVDSIRVDTVFVTESPDEYKYNFHHNDPWFNFNGKFKIDSTQSLKDFALYNIKIPVPLKLGISDKRQIFVTSENPYINIYDVDGAEVMDNIRKSDYKKFHHGIGIGFGAQYGLINKQFDVGPYVGYNLIFSF